MSELPPSIPDEVLTAPKNAGDLAARPNDRDAKGRLLPGHSGKWRGGGRPKRVREFEKMLSKVHGSPEKMLELMDRLRNLAMGEPELVTVANADGTFEVEAKIKADAAFMKLYLDRLLGPAVANDELPENFLEGASPEVIEFLRIKIRR